MKKRLYPSIAAALFSPGLLLPVPLMAQVVAASSGIDALIKPLRSALVGPVLASPAAPQNYKDFLKIQQAIRFDQLPEGAKVESRAALADMLHYFKNTYDGLDVTQTVTVEGEIFDCIPLKQQPALRNDPSLDTTVPAALAGPQSMQGSALVHRGAQSCAAGTIPFKRVRLDALIRYPTLEDAIRARRSHPIMAPLADPISITADTPCPTPGYSTTESNGIVHNWIEVAYPWVNANGAMATLSIWQPKIYSLGTVSEALTSSIRSAFPSIFTAYDRDSIAQVWLAAYNHCGKIQTLEAGSQVAPWWHTDKPVLFIYSTAGDYAAAGDNYNLDGGRFVQISSNVTLGQALPPEQIGGQGNDVSATFAWIREKDKWYFKLDDEVVGYYPAKAYSNGGLSENTPRMSFAVGGEVVAMPKDLLSFLRETIYDCKSTNCAPEMGSGLPARDGYGKAAYAKDINYLLVKPNQGPNHDQDEIKPAAYKNSDALVHNANQKYADTGFLYTYQAASGIFDAQSNRTGFPIDRQSYNNGAAFYFGGDGLSQ